MISDTWEGDPREHGSIDALRTMVRSYLDDEGMALVERAYAYAADAHAGRLRHSGHPYIVHPIGTAQRLTAMRLTAPIIAAGLLHDVVEDAHRTTDELRRLFGREIASLVDGITKTGTVRLHGEARYIENLRKMFVAMAKDIRVIIIKFCDRLHNLETLAYVPEPKRTRIARESLEIYAPIANRLGMYEIKAQLEDLAFPYVYPEDAQWVNALLATIDTPRTHARCDQLMADVRTAMETHRIPLISIEGRVKHRFSLYQKLLRCNRDIQNVYDHVALRVVVENVTDCYAVLGIIHQRWQPIRGRIKDYIANPKPNGYRSLHTTVTVDGGDVVEFQVRTRAMHEEAEWGAAAAWRYHERGTYQPPSHQLRWVEDLVQWQRGITDPKEFLEGLKLDILHHRIFVLTPKGDVIDLPEGATPIDFAYAIHSDIGDHAIGARVNANTALYPLDRPLENGETIEILVDPKRRGPSPDWLTTARTGYARERIRESLRRRERQTVAALIGHAAPSPHHGKSKAPSIARSSRMDTDAKNARVTAGSPAGSPRALRRPRTRS